MANRWGIPKDVEELVKQRDLSCVYCGISFTNSRVDKLESKITTKEILKG